MLRPGLPARLPIRAHLAKHQINFSPLSILSGFVGSATSEKLITQLIERGLCLAERGGIEAFGKPTVNPGKQTLRLRSAPLRLEPSREGRCSPARRWSREQLSRERVDLLTQSLWLLRMKQHTELVDSRRQDGRRVLVVISALSMIRESQ